MQQSERPRAQLQAAGDRSRSVRSGHRHGAESGRPEEVHRDGGDGAAGPQESGPRCQLLCDDGEE